MLMWLMEANPFSQVTKSFEMFPRGVEVEVYSSRLMPILNIHIWV